MDPHTDYVLNPERDFMVNMSRQTQYCTASPTALLATAVPLIGAPLGPLPALAGGLR